MAILHTGLAKVLSGDQEITPSSNDWDYSFSQDEWKCSGRETGSDNDMDGAVDNDAAGDSGVTSLYTFEGDFDVEFTIESFSGSTLTFGVHAIDEDSTRTTAQHLGLDSMTDSFWYNDSGGLTNNVFFIGGSSDSSTVTLANGDDIKMERRSGTITVYQNDASLHVFTSTDTTPMRFAIGQANVTDTRYDNFKFTDVEKVQRDGFINEARTGDVQWGDGISGAKNMGQAFVPTRTGTVSTVTIVSTAVYTSFTGHCEIWGHDGTNPTSQIGSDSDSIVLDAVQNWTFTFSSEPEVNKGSVYWIVFVDEGTAGDIAFDTTLVSAQDFVDGWGLGFNDTITSITDSETNELAIEIVTNATGEPTPDHDTLLLIHSNDADTSTAFTDSSQFGRTVTVGGDAQHATAQQHFGASAIAFDGTGDYLSVPSFNIGTGDFTMEAWIYRTDSSAWRAILGSGNWGGPDYDWTWDINHSTDLVRFSPYNGSTQVEVNMSTAITLNTWTHVAVVRCSGTITQYLNGSADGTTISSTHNLVSNGVVYIGEQGRGVPWQGYLDEVRISNVARWSTNFTPSTSAY